MKKFTNGMTVADLIEKLSQFPPDVKVIVSTPLDDMHHDINVYDRRQEANWSLYKHTDIPVMGDPNDRYSLSLCDSVALAKIYAARSTHRIASYQDWDEDGNPYERLAIEPCVKLICDEYTHEGD